MIMKEAREQIVACGNRMIADRLTLGTSGNLSIYDPAEGLMAISPSGVAYADTKPEDIVIMDLEGNIIGQVRWSIIQEFSENLAVVVENKKSGYNQVL